jgi:hypothetical protein
MSSWIYGLVEQGQAAAVPTSQCSRVPHQQVLVVAAVYCHVVLVLLVLAFAGLEVLMLMKISTSGWFVVLTERD